MIILHMPKIKFNDIELIVPEGTTLRKGLLEQGCSPHNGQARWLNCKGLGTCGTCAVEVLKGEPSPMTKIESWRLNFPPHKLEAGLRLACQLELRGPMDVRKHQGFWGEKRKT